MLETILGALLIFSLRIVDVSIGTVRIVVLMRGHVGLAAVLGFFESITWVVAASVVFANLGDPVRAIAFAAGFGTGVLVGGLVERWIAMGTAFVRVVAPIESPQVAEPMRAAGFPMTVLNAEGRDGDVRLALLVLPRRRVKEALAHIQSINPDAFVTVEEVNLPDLERMRRTATVRK
jgi:uncharacterized protein YebE (UPF0316 family)